MFSSFTAFLKEKSPELLTTIFLKPISIVEITKQQTVNDVHFKICDHVAGI
jgi:hypothetical protein